MTNNETKMSNLGRGSGDDHAVPRSLLIVPVPCSLIRFAF